MNDRLCSPSDGGPVASRHVVKLLIDPDTGRLLDVSEAAAGFYGLSRDALRQLSVWDLTPGCDREETLAMLAEVAAGRDLGVRPGSGHRRHDGERCEVLLCPDLIEQDGRVLILATVIEVTVGLAEAQRIAHPGSFEYDAATGQTLWSDRKLAEERRRCSEERLRLALDGARMGTCHWTIATGEIVWSDTYLKLANEAAGIGVWEWDLVTDCNFLDSRAYALYGLREEDGPPAYAEWAALVHPDDLPGVEAQLEAHRVAGEDVRRLEFRIRWPDGTVRWLAEAGKIERDGQTGEMRRVYGVSWDITEQKRAEDEIRSLNAELEQRVAARTAELREAGVALRASEERFRYAMEASSDGLWDWDLQTGAVYYGPGYARMLGYAPEALAQDLSTWADLLHPEERERVLATTMRLLDDPGHYELEFRLRTINNARIEAGRLPLDLRPFALVPLLSAIDDLLGATARGKGLAFRITPPTLDGGLVGDPLRLQQVLVNLLGNAVKFTSQGEVRLRITPLDCTPERVRLRFAVADTGIGLTPHALAGLFRPFTQADGSITRRFGGTGLGLSISKRLVELMGGVIGAESRVAEGSTFWFEVPFARTAELVAVPPTAQPRATAAGQRLAGVHLLVVDDSDLNRVVAERMLALEGARVSHAADGREALEHLRAQPAGCDAVLMDVQMPGMDGLTATRLIRTEPGLTGLPIIALTAGVLPTQQEAALAAGMNGVLTKPLDLERMVALLSQWVRPRSGPAVEPAAAPVLPPQGAEPPAAAFPDLPGIDRASVVDTLMGNRALFLDVLKRFAAEFAEVVTETRRALAAGDIATARRRMHTLKGNAGTLGALDLMGAAAGLEEAIERGETGLDARLEALGTGIGALIAASAPWCGTVVARPAAVAAPPIDAQRLAQLREDLRTHDLAAFDTFEALRPGLCDALGEALCDTLGRAIHDLKFAQAQALLDQATAGHLGG